MEFRNIWSSLQDIGGLLVKRGTAMGPLVPSLLLSPIFVIFAWLFRSTAVIGGVHSVQCRVRDRGSPLGV